RAIKPGMARAADADWEEVGSDLEALLREAGLMATRRPPLTVQLGAPELDARAIPSALARDVLVVMPSIEADSVELIAAAADGRPMIQRTRRSGADLPVHAQRVMRFFHSALARRPRRDAGPRDASAPIV